jgi:hypothetical protein
MANALSPFGFRSLRHAGGGDATRLNEYDIAAGYATNLMEGDMVKSDGAGHIVLAGPADAILGRFKGVRYTNQDGSYAFSNWWKASTPTKTGEKIVATVEDDPNLLFQVQTLATVTYANQGKFVDLVAGAGNAVTGKSTQAVGAPGGAASQFQVVRVLDNQPMLQAVASIGPAGPINILGAPKDGQYAILEVRSVKHERAGAVAGIAV